MKKDVFDTPPAGFKRVANSTGWLVPHSTTQDKKIKELRKTNINLQSAIADLTARLDALEIPTDTESDIPKSKPKKVKK
jgi:hypothetical protein